MWVQNALYKKFKQSPYSSRKIIATLFWHEKGFIFYDFMERGTKIIAEMYSAMTTRVLKL